jgi:hypothetical protein
MMQASGVEKAKGRHSKLNLYLKQWVLSLLLCLLESSNLKEQVKKLPFFSLHLLFTLQYAYIFQVTV